MYFFGDSFDLYAATTDAYQGGTYWDSGLVNFTIAAGRFSGSRALQNSTNGVWLRKASGQNDSVHHFNIAYQQTAAITGSVLGFYIQLVDGVTNQCAIVFRGDGAILLTSGGPAGTVLATYTGAVTASNTWYGFEIEVVIHNTAGSFTVRKNGNTSNDFSLGSLNTRGGTANNYANQVVLGQSAVLNNHLEDDFLWRSDASSVAWVGDIRCYTRMPASDASVQWTPSAAVVPLANHPGPSNTTDALLTLAWYLPFVAPCDGTIATVTMQCSTAVVASIKSAIYASAAGAPTTALGSAGIITNPAIGTVTWTFATPVPVTRGVTYYVAFIQSASSGAWVSCIGPPPGGYAALNSSGGYASFPISPPPGLSSAAPLKATINITPTLAVNAPLVADTQQDAAASYVSSSTVGQTDLYGIAPISVTPASVVGVTTRALCQKTDAGTRNIGVQLKSGATTSNGTSTALNTSWSWVFRNDLVDPNTGAAWTPIAVNNLQIGELVTA